MNKLQTSLLREKFVINDSSAGKDGGPVVALSNRITVDLTDEKGAPEDSIVVRAQNMHSCTRMAAKIVQSHISSGSLLTRSVPYDWAAAWDVVAGDYEKAHNPLSWVVVYSQGKVLFSKGDHHPFFDVIENCQANNRDAYEKAIPMAEDAFRTMGKVVRIDYDGNYALTLNLEPKQARVGVIVRSPLKTATFNFSVAPKGDKTLNYPQCIGAAAAFLEGMQLAFMVGMNQEKIRVGKIARHSKEEKQTTEGRSRLNRLNSEISTLENAFEVRYRPERPDFNEILNEAEALAKRSK